MVTQANPIQGIIPMSEQTQSDVIVESSPQVEDDISSLELPNLQQNNEVM